MARQSSRGVHGFCQDVLPSIAQETDGERVLADAERIIRTDRWNSFDKFHETTATLVDLYERAGATPEVYTIQTGVDVGTGRWVIAEASDIRSVTADIVRPIRRKLIDYRRNPWQVYQWSAATSAEGMTCELVVVDSREELRKIRRGRLTGKAVLTRMEGRDLLGDIAATGAVAVIVDRGLSEVPDATLWSKFGWGAIPLERAACRLVGLALSRTEGARLRELIAEHGKVAVHVKADIQSYIGTHDQVSGLVLGLTPDEEVWALSHSAEPGAIDNASGVVTCVEIARVLNGMIAAGRLPQPKRSIRLLSGFECYSFFHYLEHKRRLAPPLAGVCIDSVGARPEVSDGRLQWHDTVPSSAGFVNELGATILRATLGLGRPLYALKRMEFVPTLDTLIGDPKYGFPCPWITTHRRPPKRSFAQYHSSADTIDLLCADGLATAAAGMAAYLYYLADAGNPELTDLANTETRKAIRALNALGKQQRPADPATRADYIRRQHDISMRRLARWIWGGDRGEILSRLDAQTQTVSDAAAAAIGAAKPRRRRKAAADRRIPRRTAPLIPQLDNAPPPIAHRIAGAALRHRDLFWADGTRDLADIADAIRCERNQDVKGEQVREYFEGHAQLDYVELIDPEAIISKRRLVEDLKALGVENGMTVMLHSSLARIGHVDGGADTVIDAILAAVGKRGTLLAPTFTFGTAKVYNPATTPGLTGTIPEAMRRRRDAVRSDHPTHPCVALGADAGTLCAGHVAAGIWSADSPIGRLIHGGGHILSLGVGQIYSTAYHVAEVSMPCTAIDQFGNTRRVVDADGEIVTVPAMAYRQRSCPVRNDTLGDILDRRGLRRHGRVGEAASTLVKALDLWTVQRNRLRRHCPTCTIKPKYETEPAR